MAYSREIIKKVLQYVRFRVPQTEEKNSYYTEIENTLVRISNHCTRLRVWDEILEKNPKWKGKPIISIVFEDDEDTFDEVDCLVLKRFRMKPIKVTEYVYRLQGDPQFITPQDERLIISGIKQVQGGKYTDLTNKCSEPILRVSQNPPSVPPNNQELNTEQYMDKKLIRLTENDLHKIVKESVNKVLLKEWHDMRGEYVEGWIELAKDLYTRLNWVRYGIGEYLNTMDTQYHSQPYNQHMLKSLEYIEMAEKEMNQAKQDFMDMSNSKQQPNQP